MDIFEAEMARRFVVAVEKIANALDHKTEPQRGYMWTCPKCGTENHSDFESCPCCGYDRKTENCSEIPNNCEDEPQTDCAWR